MTSGPVPYLMDHVPFKFCRGIFFFYFPSSERAFFDTTPRNFAGILFRLPFFSINWGASRPHNP